MIRGFEPARRLEPEGQGHMQWGPALTAGLIAGAILLIVPRGSPWSSVTFFSPVIMGRALPPGMELPVFLVWLLHLGISIVYGLMIARIVAGLTQSRAVLTGGVVVLMLYLVNLVVVAVVWPRWRGSEVSVTITHIVFGLIAAGAYRGLLRRKPATSASIA